MFLFLWICWLSEFYDASLERSIFIPLPSFNLRKIKLNPWKGIIHSIPAAIVVRIRMSDEVVKQEESLPDIRQTEEGSCLSQCSGVWRLQSHDQVRKRERLPMELSYYWLWGKKNTTAWMPFKGWQPVGSTATRSFWEGYKYIYVYVYTLTLARRVNLNYIIFYFRINLIIFKILMLFASYNLAFSWGHLWYPRYHRKSW